MIAVFKGENCCNSGRQMRFLATPACKIWKLSKAPDFKSSGEILSPLACPKMQWLLQKLINPVTGEAQR